MKIFNQKFDRGEFAVNHSLVAMEFHPSDGTNPSFES